MVIATNEGKTPHHQKPRLTPKSVETKPNYLHPPELNRAARSEIYLEKEAN